MKKTFIVIGAFIVALILIAILVGFSGLIWWGIGNLVISVFDINITWTFMHGLATGILVDAITGIFRRR